MRMSENIIGLDIGGANLKAATPDGRARSMPFALWKHPERLGHAIADLLVDWPPEQLAVTMTGELCDCFETKRAGVRYILDEIQRAYPGVPIQVWSTAGRLIPVLEARDEITQVAAANWHALATFMSMSHLRATAKLDEVALLIDVGSTTTDIIPIVDGRPAPVGYTDSARLHSQELVYTGVRRTPICALLQDGVAAELFATTLDAYVLLEMIPEDPDDRNTADGRSATRPCSHARMARMLGGDAESISLERARDLADQVFLKQRQMIGSAIRTVIARYANVNGIYISGSGEFLARLVLGDLKLDSLPTVSLAERLGAELSQAACAYAVARLLQAASKDAPG